MRKDVTILKEIHRTLPYALNLVNAATLDTADAISRDATRDRETGQIFAMVKVYGNKSRVSFKVTASRPGHCELCISMLEPCSLLSEDGQARTLRFLSDNVAQLLENTFPEPIERNKTV